MNSQVSKAMNKEEAMIQISSLSGTTVELDYDARTDVVELIKLGRQHGVGILFRAQELILVESLRALKRGLDAEKNTWRQRILCCTFNLSTLPADDAKDLYARASELGDTIVPADLLSSFYEQWKN